MSETDEILFEQRGALGLITLNRPKALNALNSELLDELVTCLEGWDSDDTVRAIVLTGSERAFAAGADIKEMAPRSYMDMFKANFFAAAADRILLGSDFPNIPYPYLHQLGALAGLGLGEDWLRGVCHGNAVRLLGLREP